MFEQVAQAEGGDGCGGGAGAVDVAEIARLGHLVHYKRRDGYGAQYYEQACPPWRSGHGRDCDGGGHDGGKDLGVAAQVAFLTSVEFACLAFGRVGDGCAHFGEGGGFVGCVHVV